MLALSLLITLPATAGRDKSASTSRTVSSRSAATCQAPDPLLGDLNADCVVNTSDLLILLGSYGGAGAGDLDGDGTVDAVDVAMIQAVFGRTCGMRLLGDVDGSGVVNTADLNLVNSLVQDDRYDVNDDGVVDSVDQAMVLANFGATMGARVLGDVTGDHQVTAADSLALTGSWGASGLCAADVDGDGALTTVDADLISARLGASAGTDALIGDLNGDDAVDDWDLDLMVAAQTSAWSQADLNGDGAVDTSDQLILLGNLYTVAGQVLDGDVDGNWVVDGVDLDLVLATMTTSWAQADLDGTGTVLTPDLMIVNGNTGAIHGDWGLGDIDGSCTVDGDDLALLTATFGTSWVQADLDASGTVGTGDLLAMTYGAACE